MRDNEYTARITSGPQGKGYDIVEMVTGPEETVRCTMHVQHYDGRITWADSWGLVPTFEQLGIVQAVNRGPNTYGHVDCYFR